MLYTSISHAPSQRIDNLTFPSYISSTITLFINYIGLMIVLYLTQSGLRRYLDVYVLRVSKVFQFIHICMWNWYCKILHILKYSFMCLPTNIVLKITQIIKLSCFLRGSVFRVAIDATWERFRDKNVIYDIIKTWEYKNNLRLYFKMYNVLLNFHISVITFIEKCRRYFQW